jgi:glycosyltransferase involved in cell wall biosynthesis
MAIKKILMVCQAWPTFEHSGLAFCAGEHCTILSELGYELCIASSNPRVLEAVGKMPIKDAFYIPLDGFNFLTFRKDINQQKAQEVIDAMQPDLILVEAWQTAIGDAFIELASKSKIKVAMISHGISLHPFSWRPKDLVRSLSWLPYRWLVFPGLIKKLTLLSALDLSSNSKRFFDREYAKRFGIPVTLLVNAPVHYSNEVLPLAGRKRQVLIVGYFSDIKNQLAALRVAKSLKKQKILFKFVGDKKGTYFQKCINFVVKNDLQKIVVFEDDKECDLSIEISQSIVVFSPSSSEALSIVLLEAMASGTPIVATSVGANKSLVGAILADSYDEQLQIICELAKDQEIWKECSTLGQACYKNQFSKIIVKEQVRVFLSLVESK